MKIFRTLLPLLLCVSPVWATNSRVVPGQQLGAVHINADLEAVVKALGKPQGGDAAMGKSISTYYGEGGKTRLDIYAERDFGHDQDRALVQQIRANSRMFATRTGDSVGDTLTQLRRHFPLLRPTGFYRQGNAHVTVYDERARGIALEIKAGRCIALLIHAPNRETGLQYLPFHSNYQSR